MKEKVLYWLGALLIAVLIGFAQVAKRDRPQALPHELSEPRINEEPIGVTEPELPREPELQTGP